MGKVVKGLIDWTPGMYYYKNVSGNIYTLDKSESPDEDKIYLYDDHFTIYLNNSKKGTNISKKEVELAEKYFFEPSSESTSGCVPNITKPQPIGWGFVMS